MGRAGDAGDGARNPADPRPPGDGPVPADSRGPGHLRAPPPRFGNPARHLSGSASDLDRRGRRRAWFSVQGDVLAAGPAADADRPADLAGARFVARRGYAARDIGAGDPLETDRASRAGGRVKRIRIVLVDDHPIVLDGL